MQILLSMILQVIKNRNLTLIVTTQATTNKRENLVVNMMINIEKKSK